MEIEEKGFFKKIWTSIKDFESYEEFAASKVSRSIIYMLLLTMIFTMVVSLAYTYKFYSGVGDARKYINENIEDIKIIDR